MISDIPLDRMEKYSSHSYYDLIFLISSDRFPLSIIKGARSRQLQKTDLSININIFLKTEYLILQ